MTTDNFCFYLQNRLIQTSQTGGHRYSDTSPFSIPWSQSLEDQSYKDFCLSRKLNQGMLTERENIHLDF
jgi:hypothetical protein